ncbi:AmmeMemoRadiSam system protein A [Candidatus Woesearchaeota archaeon CG_4_10_14_0_2_um_filter_57_5]|nr:MAG: hypothetical protein AUJ68_02055 [Candidatus Woesearchaeota archaeon CG1_02_57_44]PIN68686.1 MAG: AMMECR1 domain-containing protein [Candidatus Woesearchaeota archaeon CG11_big_fil_rev_8_21_14_0_20_57_5]PIZ49206.1 MAG: AmmeMemoRadiSam system protein A [Candidatus Woesearchaeota archaeon CG_4_10_14_0_2_um_filter_57_5]
MKKTAGKEDEHDARFSALLALARAAISARLLGTPAPAVARGDAKAAVFVTLTKQGELRGCIGHLEAHLPLQEAIVENALAAAFSDPRFEPLHASELEQVRIEVSVLTPPRELHYNGAQELLDSLSSDDGVIIQQGMRKATFLPQVWEQLPGKEAFLSHLCQKAGLRADAWKAKQSISDPVVEKMPSAAKGLAQGAHPQGLRVWTYRVEKFCEQ